MIFFKLVLERFLSIIHTSLLGYCKNIKIGKGTVVYLRSPIITKKGDVVIGKKCRIGTSKIGYHTGMPFYTSILNDGLKSMVSIGDNCRINGAYIHAKKQILIGNDCVFASGIHILDSNGHVTSSNNRTVGTDVPQSISIGNNVWICTNSIILKGSTIGDNCVIAANSVVKGFFPPNSLIEGNPARIVKTLNIK